MKKIIIVVILMLSNYASAEVLGFSAGVQYWQYDIDGQVQSPVDASRFVAVDFADNKDPNFFAVLEHPVPFLPNVKIQQNKIQSAGIIPVSDPDFMAGMEVDVLGDIDLSHTDITLYYELLDNWVNLDLGLSAKYFDGYTRLSYEEESESSDFSDWVPMLYAKAQFDLPLTGLSAAATVEALSFDRNNVTDVDVALRYQNKMGLGVYLGYRTLDVDLKNINSFKSDLKVDGFYLGAFIGF